MEVNDEINEETNDTYWEWNPESGEMEEIQIVSEVVIEDTSWNTEIETDTEPVIEEVVISKHKEPGKHKLKYDTIFKGKKNNDDEEEDSFNQSIEISSTSPFYEEVHNHEESARIKLLKEKIYNLVLTKTRIDLTISRRKPSKVDFNAYYAMLLEELHDDVFTRSEIFVEFSGYFSDKLPNMFNLLNKNWRIKIINDLIHKYKIKDFDNLEFN